MFITRAVLFRPLIFAFIFSSRNLFFCSFRFSPKILGSERHSRSRVLFHYPLFWDFTFFCQPNGLLRVISQCDRKAHKTRGSFLQVSLGFLCSFNQMPTPITFAPFPLSPFQWFGGARVDTSLSCWTLPLFFLNSRFAAFAEHLRNSGNRS